MSFKSDIALSVRGISKRYRIAHNQEDHRHLADALVYRMLHPFERPDYEEFWALNNVSFDVARGDVVGIIGRNGAGKSTLLKVLSRITKPTQGEVRLYGRVGSLLEVGTGFHPELTGRENIYLNGSILGMRRSEIARQFDAIVAFAEIEKFLDTPVKRYSSGMYVRLAFAVAAHLNPEILIVDEVLAVGDAQFQKKCLGKMQDIAQGEGRTVLFVSHNLGMVGDLCQRGVVLQDGKLGFDGPVDEALSIYSGGTADAGQFPSLSEEIQGKGVTLNTLTVSQTDTSLGLVNTQSLQISFSYTTHRPISNFEITLILKTANGQHIAHMDRSSGLSQDYSIIPEGKHDVIVFFQPNLFCPQPYAISIDFHVPNQELLLHAEDILVFAPEDGSTYFRKYPGITRGAIWLQPKWKETSHNDSASYHL